MIHLIAISMPYSMPMSQNVFSVSELISLIKQTLEFNDGLRAFYVKGEISNFTAHRNGHWYFSIKDDNAKINCVMFSSYANSVDFKPKEGDQVLLRASVSVYALQGSVQCNIFSMQNIGLGDLFIQFERLRKKLFDLGVCDQSRKKILPKYPKRIALVTGAQSAALQDMFKVAHLKWPLVELVLFETLVQGNNAYLDIIKSLKKADESSCDLIILARGGGSIEDLWAFNNETLAMTLVDLKTPIITGVGHESDTTIVDYVSDLRAATPTQAMQLALPDIHEVQEQLTLLSKRLNKDIQNRLILSKQELSLIKSQSFIKNPTIRLNQHRVQLDFLQQRMINRAQDLAGIRQTLDISAQRMSHLLIQKTQMMRFNLEQVDRKLKSNIDLNLSKSKREFSHMIALLNAYSPLNSLERGYSLTYKDQSLIQSIQQVQKEDILKIRLKDGNIQAKVLEIGEKI